MAALVEVERKAVVMALKARMRDEAGTFYELLSRAVVKLENDVSALGDQTIVDLRQLGHEWAAVELSALAMLRAAGASGVCGSSLPGFPAVLTTLGNAGYRTHSAGRGDSYRVSLESERV